MPYTLFSMKCTQGTVSFSDSLFLPLPSYHHVIHDSITNKHPQPLRNNNESVVLSTFLVMQTYQHVIKILNIPFFFVSFWESPCENDEMQHHAAQKELLLFLSFNVTRRVHKGDMNLRACVLYFNIKIIYLMCEPHMHLHERWCFTVGGWKWKKCCRF